MDVDERAWLAERFEANRSHLRAVGYRLLGSSSEADDAVQEAWLRLSRTGADGIENLGGWLTTVVARVCLDMLRARSARREEALDAQLIEPSAGPAAEGNPEQEALLADAVGLALQVVLDTLAPAERIAFVLHDLFGVPFEEIAPIVDRSPTAARQLASRARRRVRGARAMPEADYSSQRRVVDAFLAASRAGDFAGLIALLDPSVVLRADQLAVRVAAARQEAGAPQLASEVRGVAAVAEVFRGAQGAQPALINGAPGAAWAPHGRPRAVFAFTVSQGKIVAIEIVVDPARLSRLDVMLP